MDALTAAAGSPPAASEPQLDAAASLALYESDYSRKLSSLGPDDAATRAALRSLAVQCTQVGSHARAVTLWRTASEVAVRVEGYSPATLDVLYDYGEAMLKAGQVNEALRAFASLRAHAELNCGALHARTVKCTGGHAHALHVCGRHAEAQEAFQFVLRHQSVLFATEGGVELKRDALLMANALANVLWRSGRLKEAEDMHFKVMLERTSLLGSDDLDTLRSVHNLAAVLSDRGRLVEAEALQRRVYESFTRQLPKNHPEYLNAAHNLACTLAQRGRPAEAQVVYEAILAARRACQGASHPETLMTLHNLAITVMAQGPRGRARAEAMLREALPGYLGALGPTHELTLTAQRTLALVLIARGAYVDAEAILKRVCVDAEAALGMCHPACIDAALSLADVHVLHTKKYAEAAALLQAALVGLQTTAAGVGGDARCAAVLRNIASLAGMQGKHKEAAAMRAVSEQWRAIGLRAETTQMLRHKAVDEVETATGGVFDMAAAPSRGDALDSSLEPEGEDARADEEKHDEI